MDHVTVAFNRFRHPNCEAIKITRLEEAPLAHTFLLPMRQCRTMLQSSSIVFVALIVKPSSSLAWKKHH
jgi:hypothetical protein